jgi:hypothetical protein
LVVARVSNVVKFRVELKFTVRVIGLGLGLGLGLEKTVCNVVTFGVEMKFTIRVKVRVRVMRMGDEYSVRQMT